MWIVAAVAGLVFASDTVLGKLTGDHICPEENIYTINVTEYFIRNSTIRRYEWCLNVPPRCSKYTIRPINESRVVEKEVADIIDKCCAGYEEDKESGTCRPICPDCINGKCIQGKCECFPGYKGDFCDTDCSSDEWGENCKFKCTCEHGSCDSKTGNCICPSGWTGQQCETPCSDGFYGPGCKEKCKCKLDEFCHYVTGECEESVTTTTTLSPTYKTTFSAPVYYKKPTKTYVLTKTKLNKNLVQFKNNGKFGTDKEGIVSTLPTTSISDITDTTVIVTEEGNKEMSANDNYPDRTDNDNERQFINILTTVGPQIVQPSKAKVKVKEVSESRHPHEENYLNDEAHRGNINQPPLNRNDLVSSASAATAISVAIIIVAVLIVATNHFIRTKKRIRDDRDRAKGISTVSVFTHSIFHTPLPEPPTFENPIFITPIDTNSNSTTEGQRIETRVVCSMNFPTHPVKDPREYLYDHPPSSGSYRAASIPEPPDINNMSPIQSLTQGEPLYDEIPSGMPPTPVSQPPPSYKSSSLYMNTCGKTRL